LLSSAFFCCALVYAEEAKTPELSGLDSVINDSIQKHEIPGVVPLVGHNGRGYQKHGQRSLEPARSAMTVDRFLTLLPPRSLPPGDHAVG
jgi:hypothetical protein